MMVVPSAFSFLKSCMISLALVLVKTYSRFVRKKQFGLGNHRTCHGNKLLFSAGELTGKQTPSSQRFGSRRERRPPTLAARISEHSGRREGMSRFSATVRSSSKWNCWNTKPTNLLFTIDRSLGDARWTGRSEKKNSPSQAWSY